jgi:hypothetical protein
MMDEITELYELCKRLTERTKELEQQNYALLKKLSELNDLKAMYYNFDNIVSTTTGFECGCESNADHKEGCNL